MASYEKVRAHRSKRDMGHAPSEMLDRRCLSARATV